MRQGGISTALAAGVPEAVIYLQSGHGSKKAGRAYPFLQPEHLYATWRAFGLHL